MPESANPQIAKQPSKDMADDLKQLLDILPVTIRQTLEAHENCAQLIEIVLDLGRLPEARFPKKAEYVTDTPVSREEIQYCLDRVGHFGGDNRAGIEQTLHRISAIRNRTGDIIGLTLRVGRAVFGTIGMIRDLVERGQSILMLGRPGVGKTTALREIARVLADELDKRVVIIDTSNEIAGDGDIPHPAIGRARRMQVARPELQHQVMIEAVENHMPEVIVIDEIGTELEALAARTIAERGVMLVGTAHGNQLENLIKNPTLSDLVGGIQAVTLGDDEARRRGSQKTVLERKSPPTFEIAIEMQERQRWIVHEQVDEMIDGLLRGRQPTPEVRTVNEQGEVVITHETTTDNGLAIQRPTGRRSGHNGKSNPLTPIPLSSHGAGESQGWSKAQGVKGWRSQGHMFPVSDPKYAAFPQAVSPEQESFHQMLEDSFSRAGGQERPAGPNGEDWPLHIYPYGISRHQLEQVIRTLNIPVLLTKDIDGADAVLALRSHLKNQGKLKQMARSRHLPVHTLKSNTVPQMIRTLQRLLDLDTAQVNQAVDLNLFARSGAEDELEALEEARLAVEQIVIPKGQPVELLPRSGKVRKMQHELVEHYRLKSDSFGEEPNRRLRIYPA
ncbi:R3H domain-containing nucleic acid-binding protein [Roseofilum capinflatum]|uniref:AAA family ATPase n=1 Tax=Roseofilum capinflatum BLCC-M114 TaxID=3022440 RepID=A0ABT7BCK5_9CYAN|nr:AAA family ATPase [Roseofilum capinflatum BLCC-M114]